jgi:putative FmdB family regulatory protein
MPIYEYECAKCGKTIEVIQKMSDKPLKKHEKCGGSLTKLISAAGFQFKGTGWYVTDYGRKDAQGDSKEGKEAKEAKEATDSKADSKKDTKETSSNANKEGSGAKASAEKTEKKDTGKKDSSKSGSKKE